MPFFAQACGDPAVRLRVYIIAWCHGGDNAEAEGNGNDEAEGNGNDEADGNGKGKDNAEAEGKDNAEGDGYETERMWIGNAEAEGNGKSKGKGNAEAEGNGKGKDNVEAEGMDAKGNGKTATVGGDLQATSQKHCSFGAPLGSHAHRSDVVERLVWRIRRPLRY